MEVITNADDEIKKTYINTDVLFNSLPLTEIFLRLSSSITNTLKTIQKIFEI